MLHLVAVRFDQHVREDRDRVLALDDALEQLQFAQQIGLADDQFHVVVTSKRMRVRDGAAIPSEERDQRTKNYNRKEVLLKSRFNGRLLLQYL